MMPWWMWLVVGLVLIVLEMASAGGFYVIFFGIAALAVGGLHLFGLAGPAWMQLLLFSVLSVGSLLLFRSPLIRLMKLDRGRADVDSLAGETAIPLEDIAAGAVGRVELRGTTWTARNPGHATLRRGARCTVLSVDGLTLMIQAEGA